MPKNDTQIQWVLTDTSKLQPGYFKFRISPMGYVRRLKAASNLSDATIVTNDVYQKIQKRALRMAKWKKHEGVVWNMVTVDATA